jgi:uncharacterized protein YecE (DUF72 family)
VIVVAQRGEERRRARELAQLDRSDGAAAGSKLEAAEGMDDLTRHGHVVDDCELDPLNVAHDGDAQHEREPTLGAVALSVALSVPRPPCNAARVIRVGTCSWADDSFVKAYYPRGVDRLRYYAERFDVVEANSSYYRLPDEALVAGWADKLPEGFVMHVKAFGMMTRHPVKVQALPPDLRAEAPVDERGRVQRPSLELRAEVFRRFVAALEPLRTAGKLGGILMQLAPYVVPKPSAYEYLEWVREQLAGEQLLIEFRHRDWFLRPTEPLSFLEANEMTYVSVDTPVFPLVIARTGPTAYVRFHGRNEDTWFKRTGSAGERFDYLYSDGELGEWAATLRELAANGAEDVYAMFNNNGRSSIDEGPPNLLGDIRRREIAQAPTNATTLKAMIAGS